MTNEEKLSQLFSLKEKIQTREFQEWIMKPLYAELENIKNAYDCDSLIELHTVKGRKQGLTFLIKLLKTAERELKNTKYDIESSSKS